MTDLLNAGVSIVLAIVGIALLAVLLSKNSNTQGIITAGGTSLAQDIGAAVAPITGSGFSLGNETMGAGFYS